MSHIDILADQKLGKGVVNEIYKAMGVPEKLWELSRQAITCHNAGDASYLLHESVFRGIPAKNVGLAYTANRIIYLCTCFVVSNPDLDREECISEVMERLRSGKGFADWGPLKCAEPFLPLVIHNDPLQEHVHPN